MRENVYSVIRFHSERMLYQRNVFELTYTVHRSVCLVLVRSGQGIIHGLGIYSNKTPPQHQLS